MKNHRSKYEKILQKIERMIIRMQSMHTPSLSFGTGVIMHPKEIHTVQAIGRYPKINITKLAEYTGVTKGAVSQTIKKLTRKGLVQRTHAPGNAKEVVLELTDPGWIGFRNHEKFHMDTYDIAQHCFGEKLRNKLERIDYAADDINKILDEYEKLKKE